MDPDSWGGGTARQTTGRLDDSGTRSIAMGLEWVVDGR